MSNLFSTTPNYSGRQGDNTQDIKQFVTSPVGIVNWVYKTIVGSTTPVITPYDQKKTVMIPKDLLVLGSINNPSDITLKDNIEAINLDNFNKLNPVSFTFKDDEKNKKHYGFIAQELLEAPTIVGITVPKLVATTNPDKYEVAPAALLPIMVKAIQELNAKFETYVATHP